MHIPDGVLDPATCVVTGAVSAAVVGYALRRVRIDLPERTVPLMGVTAACVFAAQMLNFPVPGGTSGHILGGVLAGVMLGPWAGILTVTVVLMVQCLLFQDGGLTALGANVLNMAVVGAGAGYAVYDLVRRAVGGLRGTLVGATLAAWFVVMIGATLCSLELAIGGHYRLSTTLSAMLLAHTPVGIGEALATGLALSYVLRVRPDLVYGQSRAAELPAQTGQLLVVGLLAAVFMAAVVSPWASALPDGLEASLDRLGFADGAAGPVLPAPLADYQISGWEGFAAAGALAGVIGTLVVFLLTFVLARNWLRASPAQDGPAI
jgi:cobalt/nickel transport system permease protein